MSFQWDKRKAQSNFLKHGVTFDEAVTIFADPYLLFTEDHQHSQGEVREWAIGESEAGYLLVIIFTMRDTEIRIISARKPTNKERKRYEQGY